jgi:MFS transporter, DHA1 family, multidrug resistance protein
MEHRRPDVRLWLLASFTFSGTLDMHVFVPTLPSAAKDLGASAGAMQMTVSPRRLRRAGLGTRYRA